MILGSIVLGGCFYLLEHDVADFSLLLQPSQAHPSIVVDDSGIELFRFERDHRAPVNYFSFPKYLVDAFVATEDRSFFSHYGISVKGIIRSLLVNLWNRRVVQGASTITQQVVRLMFLSSKRTMWRKLHEVLLAFQLEQRFTKQQIFEIYLNNIYFGRGIYGVEAACKRFWNKSVSDITLPEAAVLAAIAKSAFYFSPLNAPESAQKRRDVVLACMRNLGCIDSNACVAAQSEGLVIHELLQGNSMRLYLQEWIRMWIERRWGREALYNLGLRIKLTINTKTQEAAEEAFDKKTVGLKKSFGETINGSLISIAASTGKIKAVVGGFDFKKSEYNRAFQAVRQMGSSFKPILYAAGLAAGFELDSVFVDEPLEFPLPGGKSWKPKNWDNRWRGPLTLAQALTASNNIVAIKLLQSIGTDPVIKLAKDCGITRSLRPYLSLALGTAEATLEENAAAFNIFANDGVYVRPHLVEWVRNSQGNKIWSHVPEKRRVVPSTIARTMVQALAQRMAIAKAAMPTGRWLSCESIGKTGSTNEAASIWFLGSTPSLTTAVYIGHDDNKPLGREVFASGVVFPIWFEFNKSIAQDKLVF